MAINELKIRVWSFPAACLRDDEAGTVSAKGGRARRNESEDFLAGEIERAAREELRTLATNHCPKNFLNIFISP